MVAPWLGCMFGGFLYDAFIYTGQSPVNAPFLGLSHFCHPRREVRAKLQAEKDLQMV
jgi:aquaglyceroporin related protein